MTINNCKTFNSEKDLQKLTGLSHNELWANGFDLDDWSFGFCCEKKLNNHNASWLLCQMEHYCCGYKVVNFNGYYYYMVYHS